jgi:hypothetical protein
MEDLLALTGNAAALRRPGAVRQPVMADASQR